MNRKMTLKRDPSKALQIGFVVLLVISIAQVAWWVTDYVRKTRADRMQLQALYSAEADAVAQAYAGAGEDELERLLPHLDVNRQNRSARVRPEALAVLDSELAARNNQYMWEGGFFLAVLLGGLIVLTRTIRHDAELRRRQQNFLAAVSHEFKSPLASVRLAAETLVLRSKEPDSERLGQRILEEGDRLLRMVDNLLDTTRLEEGQHTLAPQTTRLSDILESGIAAIHERAAQHGIAITLRADTALTLSVDRTAFETILRNLLDNAVKACIAGEGQRIEVALVEHADSVELAVHDDGLGFPPEDAVMMFEKFYRLGDELRRTTPGTGLGLYIVKRLAELSRARVRAASEGPGRGASVTVTWPKANPT
jgi:signal transduction histidine kinase